MINATNPAVSTQNLPPPSLDQEETSTATGENTSANTNAASSTQPQAAKPVAEQGISALEYDANFSTTRDPSRVDNNQMLMINPNSVNPSATRANLQEQMRGTSEQLTPNSLDNKLAYANTSSETASKPTQGSPAIYASKLGPAEPVTKADNKLAVDFVRSNKNYIQAAAKQYDVAPEVVGNILFEEKRHAGIVDKVQDNFARAWLKDSSAGKTTLSLEDYKSKYKEFNIGREIALKSAPNNTSFGSAQMQLATVKDLIGSGHLKAPNGVADVNVPNKQEWAKLSADDKNKVSLNLLLSDKATPYLVAARNRQTIEHWSQKNGTDLSNPTNLPNRKLVVDTNHYRILTQLYSVGLDVKGKVSAESDLRKFNQVNESGQHAITNFPVTVQALYSKSAAPSFEGEWLPARDGGLYPDLYPDRYQKWLAQ
jgi:hypothetical protein